MIKGKGVEEVNVKKATCSNTSTAPERSSSRMEWTKDSQMRFHL